MRTYKKKTIEVLDQTLCDVCGKICTDDRYRSHENATLEASWFHDTKFEIHLCENCFGNTLGFLRQQRQDFLGPCNYPYDNDPLKGYYEQ
jgi:hypothetical protein